MFLVEQYLYTLKYTYLLLNVYAFYVHYAGLYDVRTAAFRAFNRVIVEKLYAAVLLIHAPIRTHKYDTQTPLPTAMHVK